MHIDQLSVAFLVECEYQVYFVKVYVQFSIMIEIETFDIKTCIDNLDIAVLI